MTTNLALLIAVLLFVIGCGTDSPREVATPSNDAPTNTKPQSPQPTAERDQPNDTAADDQQSNNNAKSPAPDAFDDPEQLTRDAIDLINNGDGDDWQNASDELKISACFIYSTQKTSDLDQAGHIEMAKRYRDTLDDVYEQLGKKDKVIEILALTLTLDGQEWIKELRAKQAGK